MNFSARGASANVEGTFKVNEALKIQSERMFFWMLRDDTFLGTPGRYQKRKRKWRGWRVVSTKKRLECSLKPALPLFFKIMVFSRATVRMWWCERMKEGHNGSESGGLVGVLKTLFKIFTSADTAKILNITTTHIALQNGTNQLTAARDHTWVVCFLCFSNFQVPQK